MEGIKYWIEAESGGHYFFYAFPVALVLLLVLLKGRRIKFLLPAVLISIVIVNPLFYQLWDNLGLYAYWRILWIVPVIPVVAAIVPCLMEKINNRYIKGLVAAVGVACVIFGGSFVYEEGSRGTFVQAANAAKLPDNVVQIVDRLLEIDPEPRVVFQYPLGTYVRQYVGDIDQLFGRNIEGYIISASSEARTVNNALNNPESDLNTVATLMANDEYRYLVADGTGREEKFNDAGFVLLDTVAGYGIYEAHGTRSLLKERNEFGLVISTTTVDENGAPVNGDAGYAKVTWEYDDNGFVIREFRTDVENVGVADSNGRAGYERQYDSIGHVIMERYIDPEGAAIANSNGYAEYRREYKGSNLVLESYYDADGMPVNRADTGYAIIRMTYDDNRNRISESYFNAADEAVKSNYGYAKVVRKYDMKKLIEEAYFGTEEEPVYVAAGYSIKRRSYDDAGNIASESYYDESGKAINNVNGYSIDERGYDENRNIILQRFLDSNYRLVVTGSGYAEVHRTYQGNNLIREEYYGTDGAAYCQPAGYSAIEQEWAESTLVSRTYLNSEGQALNRTDGYAKAVWEQGENCVNLRLYNTDGEEIEINSINLARDVKENAEGWSSWQMPVYNLVNSCQNIGYTNLGPKQEGDVYTSTIEIEFKNVTATEGRTLRFWTQGAQDGRWFTGNVWNGNLINLSEVPSDGVYTFTSTVTVSGEMVNISNFNIGFRCDYWGSGMYRVRNVKIEKGDQSSGWSPGL